MSSESSRNPLALDELPPDIVMQPLKVWISILDRLITENAVRCYQPEELDALYLSEFPSLQKRIKPIRLEQEKLARMWENQLITGPRLGFASEAAAFIRVD